MILNQLVLTSTDRSLDCKKNQSARFHIQLLTVVITLEEICGAGITFLRGKKGEGEGNGAGGNTNEELTCSRRKAKISSAAGQCVVIVVTCVM